MHLEVASRWRVLGEQWTANLAELRRDGVPFDLIVFTGDLGDWGHPTDYPGAIAFLKETCAALDVPRDRLFVIPGNHDVDQKTQAAAWRWVRKNIGDDPSAYSESGAHYQRSEPIDGAALVYDPEESFTWFPLGNITQDWFEFYLSRKLRARLGSDDGLADALRAARALVEGAR